MYPYGDPTYPGYAQPYASTSTAPPPRDEQPYHHQQQQPAPPLYGTSSGTTSTTPLPAPAGSAGLPPLYAVYSQPYAPTPTPPPAAVHPLNPLKGDWTTQINLPLPTSQLPPGGTIILPSGNAIPKQLAAGTELVKVTAKSCANCRTRKVKCDRRYPECSRCLKRKEACEYGEDVSIALRPTWVIPDDENLPTASQLRNPFIASSGVSVRPAYQSALPYPMRPSALHNPAAAMRTLSDMQHHQALERINSYQQHSRTVTGSTEGQQQDEGRQDEEANQSMTRLWENFLNASNLGQSSSDWRLALPTLATSLTLHLIDASMHSCCFHLPAFHVFSPEVNYFKANIDQLDIASQVIVGILTSLGARASPHSALLGIAGPDVENGEGSPEIVLSAGVRRENAWRAIVKRATDLCSSMEILQVPSARNAQTLVAFVQMLMLAEAKPKTARFFLRTAMGIFRDMQHSDLPLEEVRDIKASVGPTLFECDCRISAYLGMPPLISDDDLYEYFDGTGVHVPDLALEDLGPELDDILDPTYGPVDRAKLDRALGLTGYFVCSIQRAYASIASSRRPSPRFHTAVPALWSAIDRTHAAVQRLHRRLVQLDYVPEGCDKGHSVDYDLLISVRMDERLLDVVHLTHVWLTHLRKLESFVQDRTVLDDLVATSERRVRKCLKLLAFYSKVFYDSLDKHVVYHLFTQLEVLPNWVELAAQRQGESTEFGPLPVECVLTETELDWFTRALELACFFTPLAAERLRELNAARRARSLQQQAVPAAAAGYPAFQTGPSSSLTLPPPPTPSTFSLPLPLDAGAPGPSSPSTLELPVVSVATSLSNGLAHDQYSLDQSVSATAPASWGGVATYQSALSGPGSAEFTGSSDRNSLSPPEQQASFGTTTSSGVHSGGETSFALPANGPPALGPVDSVQQQQQQPSMTIPWQDVSYGFSAPPPPLNSISPEHTLNVPPASVDTAPQQLANGQSWPDPSTIPPPVGGQAPWTPYNGNGWS
ncbi:hypothetical protein JCM10908_000323 [Rhodotorula pacifica]|uniref:uncharacterized protein n=1 Tax=Rhodotorula pacifica TaxID=1495444 RepID=UPI00317619E0